MRRVALIVARNPKGKILLQHRDGNTTHKPNKWAFFGGHIEEGEEPSVAAAREFMEELGVLIENPIHTLTIMYADMEGLTEKHFFTTDLDESAESLRAKQTEGDGLGWFSREELRGLDMSQEDFYLANKILQSWATDRQ